MDNNGYVALEIQGSVGIVSFFHPKSNSLPGSILKKLAETITEASDNELIHVIVLKSDGDKAFCAGASFDELIQIEDFNIGKDFFMGFAGVINAIRKAPKFVIARVQGKAVGGGVGLAAAADYAIAVINADIKLSELAIGIGPFVVGPAVERKVGNAAFSALAIDATNWRNSEWAKKKGLFTEVHENIENMDEAIQRLSHNLAHSSPAAMAELKKVCWRGTEQWDVLLKERAVISGRLILSDFSRHAIQKFKTDKASR